MTIEESCKRVTRETVNTHGFCKECGGVHTLAVGDALEKAVELFKAIERERRIDIDTPLESANPHFSTAPLWGDDRGEMFGVLTGVDRYGREVTLKAFSCQHDGEWECEGWVDPLVDSKLYLRRCREEDPKIKKLTADMVGVDKNSRLYAKLHGERKSISQSLMRELQEMYTFRNFRGEERNLFDTWGEERGIPTGVGDCCAPKLLNHAILNGIKPTGLVEFYFGRENRSQTKVHGEFYSACENKCLPILGFMLCGLEEL